MELPKGADKVRNLGKEFREFLTKTNMLALALGVVIGGAVGRVVNALVADLIMPLVGMIDASGDWRSLTLNIGRIKFTYGHLLGEILDFTIIAAVVFLATKAFIMAAAPSPSKACPACREPIHPEATRCKFCTSEQPKA